MGIDIYDALSGLGAGATSLGNSIDEKRKEELRERLKKEEEARQETRTQAAEKRAADRKAQEVVGGPEMVPLDGGAYKKVYRNHLGAIIKEEAANQVDIDAFTRQVTKENVSIDSVLAQAEQARAGAESTRANMGYLGQREDRADRVAEAQITNLNEANHVASATDATKNEERQILEKARAGIGKHAIVTDATTGKRVRKLITAEFVAEQLRQAGYGYLADRLYKTTEEE